MSSLRLSVILLLLSCGLQTIFSASKQFRFRQVDRNSGYWQGIQHMQCTRRPTRNGVRGIWECILECTEDTESFMVGTNASHCILCYFQVNGATLNASEFQGTLLFERGKLCPLLLPSECPKLNALELHPLLFPSVWHNIKCIRVSRDFPT